MRVTHSCVIFWTHLDSRECFMITWRCRIKLFIQSRLAFLPLTARLDFFDLILTFSATNCNITFPNSILEKLDLIFDLPVIFIRDCELPWTSFIVSNESATGIRFVYNCTRSFLSIHWFLI